MERNKFFSQYLDSLVEKHGNKDAFQIRTKDSYKSISYVEYREDAFNLAAWISSEKGCDVKIAVLGENSYQWVVSYLGVVSSGNVVIPIDKELTGSEIENILRQAEVSTILCSEDYLDVFEEMTGKYEIINTTNCDCELYTPLCKVLEKGKALRSVDKRFGLNETDTNSLSTIVFTSGTTGFSKGVMLSRHNLLTNVQDTDRFIKLTGKAFSILPMNHTYEFTLGVLLMAFQGVTIAINDSIKNLSKNIGLFKPTLIVMVPLVAENLMSAVWNKIEAEGKLTTVKSAVKISNCLRKIGIDVRRKLFKKIIDGLGGNLEQIFVGGSFLNPSVAKQFQDFGINVNIGYGITECSPFVSGNITHKAKLFASCGVTIPDVFVKIEDPNENGEGEVLVKGESVMMGYYKNTKATEEVMRDGWFATGDIGRLDENGNLYITGRCKNLIVLNNGKNIYPEELEFLIGNANNNIKEIIVKADNDVGKETTLVAEIFVEDSVRELNPQINSQIEQSIETVNENLPYFKRIVKVEFREKEFPKTTTKKIKRY